MSTSGKIEVTISSFFDEFKLSRKLELCWSSCVPKEIYYQCKAFNPSHIILLEQKLGSKNLPIIFDLAIGFLLLFHLEKVSFANKTLADPKVNTFLLMVSLDF